MRKKIQNQKGSVTIITLVIFLLTLGGTVAYFKKFPLEKLPTEKIRTEEIKKVANNMPMEQSQKMEIEKVATPLLFVPGSPTRSSLVPGAFQNKIVFLKGGEVRATDPNGKNEILLTHTDGTVTYYSVSPGLAYLAYQKSPNEIDVLDLRTSQVSKRITTENTGYEELSLSGGEWFSNSHLYIGTHAGATPDVAPEDLATVVLKTFVVDVEGSSTPRYPSFSGSSALQYLRLYTYLDLDKVGLNIDDVQRTGTSIFYTKQKQVSGTRYPNSEYLQEFHVLDISTRKDALIGELKTSAEKFVVEAILNHGGDKFTFITIGADEKMFKYGDSGSKIFLYPDTLLFDYTSQTSNQYIRGDYLSVNSMAWSFDDKFLAFRIGAYYCCSSVHTPKDQIIVLDVSNPKIQRIIESVDTSDALKNVYPATDFQWTRDGNIIFSRKGDLYLFDPRSNAETLFSASSSNPFVF